MAFKGGKSLLKQEKTQMSELTAMNSSEARNMEASNPFLEAIQSKSDISASIVAHKLNQSSNPTLKVIHSHAAIKPKTIKQWADKSMAVQSD